MLFAVNSLTAVQFGLSAVAVLGQRLDKPAAFANLDEFGPTQNSLPRTSSAISPWISDSISQGCRDRALLSNKDPTQFKAYSVYMGDCEMPWHFCQENDASPSIEKLVDTFARLPIGMRQFVGDVVHFKDGAGGTAWKSQIVQISGGSGNYVGVFEHESSHCIDGANGIGMRSGDQTWRDAYNRDTHVVDTYAQTNHEENYAQYLGMVLYDRFTNGNLQTYPQYWQINNQIWRMAEAADTTQSWGDHILDYSGNKKCGRRWEHTPAVNPKTGALSGCEFYVSGTTGVNIISSRSMARDLTENVHPTNCSLEHIH